MTDAQQPKPGIGDTMNDACLKIGLGDGFWDRLLDDKQDDWSFVIKAHALMEAIVSSLIATHLDAGKNFEDVLADSVQMETRIKMLKALSLASREERVMLKKLGELRNQLAHKATMTGFTFATYLKDQKTAQEFAKSFASPFKPDVEVEGEKVPLKQFALYAPKSIIAISLITFATRNLKAQTAQDTKKAIEGLKKAMLSSQSE